jgi:Xaa-Pro dipeptidase
MNPAQYADEAILESRYPDHVDILKSRHDRALERAGAAHAVIFSGAPLPVFLDDYDYPFKANPHFVSWLPLTGNPHCYIVYTPGDKPILIYYQEEDYWHLPPASPDGSWTRQFDIRIVHTRDDVALHLPDDRDKCILIGEINDEASAFGIERINPGTAVNMLHFERASKTAYELECMRAASRRGVDGHRAAEAAFREGKSEFGIHLDYCAAVGHAEHELPYGNIIALNAHASVLHYQHQAKSAPEQIRSFLIDAGASFNGYASDITRTYAMADDDFATLIERFDDLQQELVGEVRTGTEFADLHMSCHLKIAKLLDETGLARGSVDTLVESGVTAAFYPHGLGHFLGIQVHDVGGRQGDDTGTAIEPPEGHPFLRLTRRLEPDQVLTIEPGLYVIDMLIDGLKATGGFELVDQARVDWLRPYGGIRIEDNVRVKDDGCENLTRDAFATAATG